MPEDFSRLAELNQQYADLPGDFADLSLITISERLNITAIATLDSDFALIGVIETRLLNGHLSLNYEAIFRVIDDFQELVIKTQINA